MTSIVKNVNKALTGNNKYSQSSAFGSTISHFEEIKETVVASSGKGDKITNRLSQGYTKGDKGVVANLDVSTSSNDPTNTEINFSVGGLTVGYGPFNGSFNIGGEVAPGVEVTTGVQAGELSAGVSSTDENGNIIKSEITATAGEYTSAIVGGALEFFILRKIPRIKLPEAVKLYPKNPLPAF